MSAARPACKRVKMTQRAANCQEQMFPQGQHVSSEISDAMSRGRGIPGVLRTPVLALRVNRDLLPRRFPEQNQEPSHNIVSVCL